MRSPKRAPSKKLERSRISKKKYKSRIFGLKNNTVTPSGRSKQAEGRGNWKVVPKDSCEIYKARRKRQQEAEEANDTLTEYSDDSREQSTKRERKKPKKKPPKKKKRERPKKYRPGKRR